MITHFSLRAAKKTHTANSILYLLLSFPLSLLYFLLIIAGISIGFSTLVIWVGVPILFLTLLGLRWIAAVERDVTARLLHIDMPYIPYRDHQGRTLKIWLRDSLTWKSLAYVLIKFPLGILSFVLVLALPLAALTLFLEPFIYLLNIFVNSMLGVHGYKFLPFFWYDTSRFESIHFLQSFIGIPLGIIFAAASRYVLTGLATASGDFARAMLCKNDYERMCTTR